MAKGQHITGKRGIASRIVATVAASVLVVALAGFGFAGAADHGENDEATFGLTEIAPNAQKGSGPAQGTPTALSAEGNAKPSNADASDPLLGVIAESNVLTNVSTRDISKAIQSIREEDERKRKEAEERQRKEDAAKPGEIEAKIALQVGDATSGINKLEPVDWTVGKAKFVEEWSARIDSYLQGTALEGYGEQFALCAWKYGVDPRFSPAISNTESTNGRHCFLPYNAWGWGSHGWSSWNEAIDAHVSGLAEGYGYSITLSGAQKYCPPNYNHWYSNTLGQMMLI